MLAIVIERAKLEGQIEGVIPHLVDGGLSILQCADYTILFMDHDVEKAMNLKRILSSFEQLSGLKTNYHKSELFVSVTLRMMLTYTLSFSAVVRVSFLLAI